MQSSAVVWVFLVFSWIYFGSACRKEKEFRTWHFFPICFQALVDTVRPGLANVIYQISAYKNFISHAGKEVQRRGNKLPSQNFWGIPILKLYWDVYWHIFVLLWMKVQLVFVYCFHSLYSCLWSNFTLSKKQQASFNSWFDCSVELPSIGGQIGGHEIQLLWYSRRWLWRQRFLFLSWFKVRI